MLRLGLGLLTALFIVGICGCGGGSGGGSGADTIAIQDFQVPANPGEVRTRLFPNTATIPSGVNNTIQWINQSPGRHQIVSGILVAKGNPGIQHLITIGNAGFSPTLLDANYGDTIQISNLSQATFNLQVLNSNGALINSFSIPIGEMLVQPPTLVFPGPGLYTLQDRDSQHVATVTLFGTPQPNGLFMSGVLSNGNIYTKAFPVPGTFPYFDSNPDDPTHVYATGTIVVQ